LEAKIAGDYYQVTGGASELDYKNALQRNHYTQPCSKSHHYFSLDMADIRVSLYGAMSARSKPGRAGIAALY
jgi:hypothetical protein